jgi:hypothetical protein
VARYTRGYNDAEPQRYVRSCISSALGWLRAGDSAPWRSLPTARA